MVKFRPVIAQNFVRLSKDHQQILLDNNVVPVNEVFFDVYNNRDFKILLLYGSFGSGKSIFAVDMLIDNCMNDEFFKCAYGRKVFDAVRMSIFDALCKRIEERGLQKYFTYSRNPYSNMWIQCKENKNLFIPFGADNPGKFLSANDITHFLCEQFEQFDLTDFGIFYSRLRTEIAKTKFIAIFNSTYIKKSHWVKKLFFDKEVISDKINIDDYKITKVFANYPQNAFLNHAEYEKTLWLSAGFNETKFREIANGEWGSEDTSNLFAWGFNEDVNVVDGNSELMKVDRKLPVYLIFDFNWDPMTCLVAQRKGVEWGKIIDEYRERDSDIYALLHKVNVDYGDCFLIASGDASGRIKNASNKGHRSNIFIIQKELGLTNRQMQFPASNPGINNTRELMNAIFRRHGNFWISSRCQFLINDLESITVDDEGDIVEEKSKEGKLKGHLLANCRYFMWNFFRSFLVNK